MKAYKRANRVKRDTPSYSDYFKSLRVTQILDVTQYKIGCYALFVINDSFLIQYEENDGGFSVPPSSEHYYNDPSVQDTASQLFDLEDMIIELELKADIETIKKDLLLEKQVKEAREAIAQAFVNAHFSLNKWRGTLNEIYFNIINSYYGQVKVNDTGDNITVSICGRESMTGVPVIFNINIDENLIYDLPKHLIEVKGFDGEPTLKVA